MKKIQSWFLFLFIFLILGSKPLFAAQNQDIEGIYKCTGYDPFVKSGYELVLTITKTQDTYHFKWDELEEIYFGTGFFSRQSPNIIATEFWNPKIRERSGLTIYSVKPNGVLEGEWTRAGKEIIGTENCKKQ
jgi:hypothetical protein